MGLYYYPPTGGFRDTAVHGPCPPEGVALTKAEYDALRAEQRSGKDIVPGPGGAPITVERDNRELTVESLTAAAEKRLRDEAIDHFIQTTPALAQKKAAIQQRKAALLANNEDPSTGWPV